MPFLPIDPRDSSVPSHRVGSARRGQGFSERAPRGELARGRPLGPAGCLTVLCLVSLLGACATFHPPASVNEVRFRDRALSQSDEDVRVSVAVPTAEEARALFGADMLGKEIQPVWVKVENHSERTYYLASTATDPNHFSPLEATYALSGSLFGNYREDMGRHFRALNFRNPVLPYSAVSGFVLTNLDLGEKIVQIDLVADRRVKLFTFFVQIPGMPVDYRRVDFDRLYPPEQLVELSEEELREALESLPCCTTDRKGAGAGDPINLVMIGEFEDVAAAFARQGWLPAEETYASAVWKTVKSFLFGSRYRYSPVSPLYLFGREQDFARQKPRGNIHQRNHLRLWYSPWRFEGKPVFVGQISRDIGVRFAIDAWPPVTHKIDPDVDEARQAIVEDLLYSQMLSDIGFIDGVVSARASRPRSNLTGDPYFTDGFRAVLVLERGPIALDRTRTLDWEQPEAFALRSPEAP